MQLTGLHTNVAVNITQLLIFKRQSHKLIKYTQTIRCLLPTNCLSEFDHFAELVLKGLLKTVITEIVSSTTQTWIKKN